MTLTSQEKRWMSAYAFTSAGPWLGRLVAFRPLVGVAVRGKCSLEKTEQLLARKHERESFGLTIFGARC